MILGVLNLSVLALGVVMVICLLATLLDYEFKSNKIGFIIASAAIFIANLAANIFISDGEITSLVSEISLVGSAMILPYFLFKLKKRFTFVWFGLIICSTFDYLESLATSFITQPTFIQTQFIYFVLYSLALVVSLLVWKIRKPVIPSDFLEQISPTLYIVLFFADYSAYYDVMLSKDSEYYIGFSNLLKLVSAALVVGCYSYIIYRYTNLSYKQKESELQLEMELKHYEEMVQKNRDIRTFRHDYKNNLYSIKTFIKSGRVDEAEKYIDELDSDLQLSANKYATGNYLADAIISGKAELVKESEIDIVFNGVIPESGISNNDLCTVISNTLDNAIRACREISPCTIMINAENKPNGFLLSVVNPVAENIVIKNNKIKTTKSDKINHGIGISNIKKTAEKYDGFVELKCENKIFTIEIGMVVK